MPVPATPGITGGKNATQWEYEQREYTREEYAAMNSPTTKSIMQAISGLELSVAELAMGKAV
ncbi:MAG: hypothetical protein RR949_04260 [Oscillospiraceae bacterium]